MAGCTLPRMHPRPGKPCAKLWVLSQTRSNRAV